MAKKFIEQKKNPQLDSYAKKKSEYEKLSGRQ